jgi:hypothetical protein
MRTRDEYERLIAGCTADIEDADDLARRLRAERCEYFREMRAMPVVHELVECGYRIVSADKTTGSVLADIGSMRRRIFIGDSEDQ